MGPQRGPNTKDRRNDNHHRGVDLSSLSIREMADPEGHHQAEDGIRQADPGGRPKTRVQMEWIHAQMLPAKRTVCATLSRFNASADVLMVEHLSRAQCVGVDRDPAREPIVWVDGICTHI